MLRPNVKNEIYSLEEICHIIKFLSNEDNVIIVLYLQGYNYDEISIKLGKTKKQVRQSIFDFFYIKEILDLKQT